MLVVHPHFHPRRTGVTTHVESVLRALNPAVEAKGVGPALAPDLPRISLREVFARAKREFVVWHAHRNLELLVGLILRAFRRRLRLVFTRHALHRPSRYTQSLARRADRRVSLTPQVAVAFGLPSQIIGHGIDLRRFQPPADKAAAWRALCLGGKRGVGVVGRIRPEKGQGDFVAAIAPLLTEDTRAILVGRVETDSWADTLKPALLVGEQPNPVPYLQGLSILVQPSRAESYSLVLLEAMASGCCVVAAHLPHYDQFIEHGRTGFFYEPGNIEALRAILKDLLDQPAKADAVGRTAAEEARRRFGVEHESQALAGLYRALVGEP